MLRAAAALKRGTRLLEGMTQIPGGLNHMNHHQQLLVMPDGGAVAVVALIDAAQETLRLKQFRLHRRPLSRP